MTDLFLRGETMQQDNLFEVTPCFTGLVNNESCVPTVSDLPTVTPPIGGGCTVDDYRPTVGLCYLLLSVGVALFIENSLLIFVIASNKSLHTNTNILVASLAVTDVVMGIQCCLFGVTGLSVGIRPWLAALNSDLHTFDMFMLSINLSLIAASLLHVFSLAVDRYLFVLWPFRYRSRVTRSRVLAVVAVIWTLGLIYTLLPLALYQDTRHRQSCILSESPASFGYLPIGCVYVVCLAVVTYCTSGLVKIARRHTSGRVNRLIGNQRFKSRYSQPETIFTVAYKSRQIECVSNVETESSHVYTRCEEQVQQMPLPCSGSLNEVVTRISDTNFTSYPGESKYVASGDHNNLNNVKEEAMKSSNIASGPSANTEKQDTGVSSVQTSITTKDLSEASDTLSPSAKDKQKCLTKNDVHNTNQPDTTMTKTLENDTDKELVFDLKKKQDEGNRLFEKSNIKIIKFVSVVFGTFFACTFPAIALLSFVKIFNLPVFHGNDFAVDILRFLVITNSSVNFITITYMNKDFRRALIKSVPFSKVCFCNRESK